MGNDETAANLAVPTSVAGQPLDTCNTPIATPVPEQVDGLAWRFPIPDVRLLSYAWVSGVMLTWESGHQEILIRDGAELSAEFTKEEKEKVWTEAAEAVKTYHEDLVRRWKEEMDTLLVYVSVAAVIVVENGELMHSAGWSVLGGPDCLQCAVLPAPAAWLHGLYGRTAPGDLFTT